jgi:mRNA (guanine-N7-)-methyltransferase
LRIVPLKSLETEKDSVLHSEYPIPRDGFLTSHYSLAAEYSLYPIYKEEFHQIFAEHSEQEEFKELMVRMKVVDANGESSMNEDQWEAASKPFH